MCHTYFSSFIAKSWLNNLEDIGQGQRSWHATHSLMLAIICAKYGKKPSRTVCAVVRKRQDVPYLSSFNVNPRLNNREDIGQCQRSLSVTHLMLVIICSYNGKNPSRTVGVTERTWHGGRTDRCTYRRTDGGTE